MEVEYVLSRLKRTERDTQPCYVMRMANLSILYLKQKTIAQAHFNTDGHRSYKLNFCGWTYDYGKRGPTQQNILKLLKIIDQYDNIPLKQQMLAILLHSLSSSGQFPNRKNARPGYILGVLGKGHRKKVDSCTNKDHGTTPAHISKFLVPILKRL